MDRTSARPPCRPALQRAREKEVKSIGIACCRMYNGVPQVLIVNKRYTYAFREFVEGKYKSADDNAIIALLSMTTAEEKAVIFARKFIMLWYRVWIDSSQRSTRYMVAKTKFENTFLTDGGERLLRLLDRAGSIQPIWEIPKGKKRGRAEADICCAIREFREETGVEKRQYALWLERPVRHSFVDGGVRYTYIYYIAMMKDHTYMPRIDMRLIDQIDEISDISWADTYGAAALDATGRLPRLVAEVSAIVSCGRDGRCAGVERRECHA